MAGKHHADLIAWQNAMDLVELVYPATARCPREELSGLTNPLRRAAVSIRWSRREFQRFLSIAHGSRREVETQIRIAERF